MPGFCRISPIQEWQPRSCPSLGSKYDRVAARGSKPVILPEGPTLRNADIVKIPKCVPMSTRVAHGLQCANEVESGLFITFAKPFSPTKGDFE